MREGVNARPAEIRERGDATTVVANPAAKRGSSLRDLGRTEDRACEARAQITTPARRLGAGLPVPSLAYDGEFIRWEQEKRPRPGAPRKRVMIPVGAPLKVILAVMEREAGVDPADPADRSRKILRNSEGEPWANGRAFYTAFHRECLRLGIVDRTFHDVRRTAVTRLAIAGCTEPEIASITGHSLGEVKSILERHYLYLDPAIAMNAIRKLENSTLRLYAQFLREFLQRRLVGSKSGTERPTELPTAPNRSLRVRSKTHSANWSSPLMPP
jgi:hypothetical protein